MPRRKIDRPAAGHGKIIDIVSGEAIGKGTLPLICERVRFYRERMGIEQKELAERIGISGNTICNWENGRGRPDINLIPALCEALSISLYDLFSMEDPHVPYTEKEKEHMKRYRSLSAGHRRAVNMLIDALMEEELAVNSRPVLKRLSFHQELAAGFATPLNLDDKGEPIYLYESPEAARADYVFPVTGDSMEPDYHNGDLVFVLGMEHCDGIRPGEVGAFFVDNEAFIKEYREDGLHSRNSAYGTMQFDDGQKVYLIGKVLGILDPDDIASEEDMERYITLHCEDE